MVCRLSFLEAIGILIPQPETEPEYPALEGRFLTIGPQGSPKVNEILNWRLKPMNFHHDGDNNNSNSNKSKLTFPFSFRALGSDCP